MVGVLSSVIRKDIYLHESRSVTLLREARPSCNEVFVAEAAALPAAGDPCRLLNGVQAPEIGPASKGGHVAVQVLGAQPVEGAHDPAFQQCPEQLDAAGMGLASHILAGAGAHALVAVLGHALLESLADAVHQVPRRSSA